MRYLSCVSSLIFELLEGTICIERRYGGLAQLVRASVSHTEGRRFESCAPQVSVIEWWSRLKLNIYSRR